MADKSKKEAVVLVTPEGRLINGHLFVKNAFKSEKSEKEGTPRYRLEMAFDKNSDEFNDWIDEVATHVKDRYGDDIYLSVVDEPKKGCDEIRSPFLDGDGIARKREKKGKKGDAYKGMWVIRADTDYNFEGQDADGGIMVYDEKVKRLMPVDKGKVYNGSMGCAKVEIGFYEDNEGNPAAKFYLKAYQKTGEGEKLASVVDHSSSFRPTGRSSSEGSARRSRAG